MPEPPPCPRCGSDAVVPDVRVLDRDNNAAHRTAQLGLARKPDALVFKREERVELTARVCSDCGHVDFYAADPQALWHAHLDRLSNR